MVDTMTSWYSVSDALTRVAVMVCVVCVTGGQLGAAQGTTYIPQCSAQGWLEAREDQTAATFMTCQGFGSNQTVSWQLVKNDTVQANSTCGPPSTLLPGGQCVSTTSDMVVDRTSNTTSSLLISSNHRELVGNGSVRCLAEDVANVGSCKINVITPAVLSDCEVTMTTQRTLAGTCNFNNAYSSNDTYTCTWTLTPIDRQGDHDVTIPGVIHKTPHTEYSKLYYRGTFSFLLSWVPPGYYSYTARFFTGSSRSQYQGSVTVAVTTTSNPKDQNDNQKGTTYIPQCSAQGWLEAQEDQTAATFMTCQGFGPSQNVSWQLMKNGTVQASSTCGPLPTLQHGGQCVSTTSDIVVRRTNDTTSSLLISNNRRELVGNGSVQCLVEDATNVGSCKINVITPPVLSDCEVKMTSTLTLAGTCNFNHAYSSNDTYTCTWTLTPTDRKGDPDVIIPGVIHKTPHTVSSKLFYKGTCSFTSSWLPSGYYSYTVRFFPGDSDSQYQGTVRVAETTTSNPEEKDQGNTQNGTTHIPQCSAQGWLETREDQTVPTFLTCRGFGSNQYVSWQLIKNGAVQASSTCGPTPTLLAGGQCVSTTSDIVVRRISNTTSSLLISNNRRELVGNGSVQCLAKDVANFDSCKINVITPAVLSDCKMTMDTHQTLAGTCNFSNAYSSNGTYTCTWTLTPIDRQGDPEVTFPGLVHKTELTESSKLYYRGTCSFTSLSLPPGHYSYIARFFPGNSDSQYEGTVTVIGNTYIPQCSAQGWLEAREDQTAATYLTCEGFGPSQNVSWQLIKNDAVQASSTCGPLSTLLAGGQCVSTTSDIVVERTSDTITSLLISNNRRELVGNGSVRCLAEDAANISSCKINVITPAELSDCKVRITTRQTLAGACNFNNAYSSNSTYTCTWTLTPTYRQGDPDVIIPGVIHKTPHTESGKLYYNGTCSFMSPWIPPGYYSYTVRFLTGSARSQYQGTVTVLGATHIPQCSAQGWLEAREDQTAATFLTCEGFGPNQDVSWHLIKNSVVQTSSTCGPLPTLLPGGQCESTTPDIVVRRTSNTTSSLLISNNRRGLVGNGDIRCLVEDIAHVGSCKIDVITPAVLSDCEVTMTTHQTLAGACNFNNAYSSIGNYTCTWTLTPTDRQGDPNVTIRGVIDKTPHTVSGKLYYNGTCSFTSSWLPPGYYSCTARFFTGSYASQHQESTIVKKADTPISNRQGRCVSPAIGGTAAAGVVHVIIVLTAVVILGR